MSKWESVPVDSEEGIAEIIRWAKMQEVPLSERHEEIAKKHGVDTSGVVFAKKLGLSFRRIDKRVG